MLAGEVPLIGTKTTDEEKDDADADVGEDDAHPDLVGQRVHEAEHVSLEVDGLLDHDGDAQGHERLGKVHHAFSVRGDRQRSDGHVGFLGTDTISSANSVGHFFVTPCILDVRRGCTFGGGYVPCICLRAR